jgi:hypothetical protein
MLLQLTNISICTLILFEFVFVLPFHDLHLLRLANFARKSRFLSVCRQALPSLDCTHPRRPTLSEGVRRHDHYRDGRVPLRSIPCSFYSRGPSGVPWSRSSFRTRHPRHIDPVPCIRVRTLITGGVPQDCALHTFPSPITLVCGKCDPKTGRCTTLRHSLCLYETRSWSCSRSLLAHRVTL